MFVKIKGESINILKLTIYNDSEDGTISEKIVTIKEGDIVKVSYIKEEKNQIDDLTGRISSIYDPANPTSYSTINQFSMTIDCSTVNHGRFETIVINNIRDIELIKEEWDDPIEDTSETTIPIDHQDNQNNNSTIPDGD